MPTIKKSQAALEFLTTYGWAFLVILIAIGALSYFGIFDIKDIITPSKCTLAPGLTCSDFKIGSEAVQIVLTNNLGEDITIKDIELNSCQGNPSSSSFIIKNNQMGSFTVGLCAITEKRYDSDVKVTYLGESGIEHTVKGEMTARNEFADIIYDYLGAGAGSGGAPGRPPPGEQADEGMNAAAARRHDDMIRSEGPLYPRLKAVSEGESPWRGASAPYPLK